MIYNKFKMEALKGSIDLSTDTIKVALLDSGYTPNIDTDIFWDDVSANEITSANYTTGGETITTPTVTQDNTDNEGVFGGDDIVWTNAVGTITARYAVMYKDTGVAGTSPLIEYIDFGADKTSENENFSISWSAEGIINAN
jgi:hypothetical protein